MIRFVDPTDEDVDAYSFRVINRTGSVCCNAHHTIMLAMILYGDEIDAAAMYAGVRSCASMRMVDLPVGDWLRETAIRVMAEGVGDSESFLNELKKRLDF